LPYIKALGLNLGTEWRYTFIVKDDLLPPNAVNGREQATISWECDFELPPQDQPGETCDQTVFIPWESFNPTYRGKLQKDVNPLDTKKIKRFSIMMRSFFGTQEGKFSLSIKSIDAVCEAPPAGDDAVIGDPRDETLDLRQLEDGPGTAESTDILSFYIWGGGSESLPTARDRRYYILDGGLRPFLHGTFKIHRQAAHGFIVGALIFAACYYIYR